jgi:hypothetical protein
MKTIITYAKAKFLCHLPVFFLLIFFPLFAKSQLPWAYMANNFSDAGISATAATEFNSAALVNTGFKSSPYFGKGLIKSSSGTAYVSFLSPFTQVLNAGNTAAVSNNLKNGQVLQPELGVSWLLASGAKLTKADAARHASLSKPLWALDVHAGWLMLKARHLLDDYQNKVSSFATTQANRNNWNFYYLTVSPQIQIGGRGIEKKDIRRGMVTRNDNWLLALNAGPSLVYNDPASFLQGDAGQSVLYQNHQLPDNFKKWRLGAQANISATWFPFKNSGWGFYLKAGYWWQSPFSYTIRERDISKVNFNLSATEIRSQLSNAQIAPLRDKTYSLPNSFFQTQLGVRLTIKTKSSPPYAPTYPDDPTGKKKKDNDSSTNKRTDKGSTRGYVVGHGGVARIKKGRRILTLPDVPIPDESTLIQILAPYSPPPDSMVVVLKSGKAVVLNGLAWATTEISPSNLKQKPGIKWCSCKSGNHMCPESWTCSDCCALLDKIFLEYRVIPKYNELPKDMQAEVDSTLLEANLKLPEMHFYLNKKHKKLYEVDMKLINPQPDQTISCMQKDAEGNCTHWRICGTTTSGAYRCYDVVKDPAFGWVVTWN